MLRILSFQNPAGLREETNRSGEPSESSACQAAPVPLSLLFCWPNAYLKLRDARPGETD